MTLDEITNSFNNEVKRHSEMYKNRLIEILQQLGLYNVDVILMKNNKKGKLDVERSDHNIIEFDINFIPYKKDGTLSKTINTTYTWYWNDEAKYIKDIQKMIRAADADE